MATYPLWDVMGPFKTLYSSCVEPVCKEFDLTRTELDILLFLANNPSCDSAADIVQKRYLAKSHVSTSIKALSQRGFLEQLKDAHDKRVIRLQVTEAAKNVILAGKKAQSECHQLMCAGISEEKLAEMNEALIQIRENIKNHTDSSYW